MSEDEMVRANYPYIRKCAMAFLEKAGRKYMYLYEDVCQEAAIAYIERARYVEAHPGTDPCYATVIYRHLFHAFQDIFGVHRTRYTTRKIIVFHSEDPHYLNGEMVSYDADDVIPNLDAQRWMQSLSKDDITLLEKLMNGERPGAIAKAMNIHRNTMTNRRNALRRSFMEYFKEAG